MPDPAIATDPARAARRRIRVGTAGWSLPAGSRAEFAAGAHALQRYASRLDVAEINSSFYRAHAAQTYARWAALVPAGFRFAVKLPRSITQYARLRGAEALLDAFFAEVAGLGPKLGRVLVQLPPSLAFEGEVAGAFFEQLRARAGRTGLACEPRHASWGCAEAEALLRAQRVSRVAADPPRFAQDAEPGGARPAYWRLHGSPRMYYDAYDEDFLHALAARVQARRGDWVVFDNTAHGHATANALRLRALLAATPR